MSVDRVDMLKQLIPPGGLSVEVGVLEGVFAGAIWDIQRPEKLVLIDIWQDYLLVKGQDAYDSVARKFGAQIADGRVEMWRGWCVDMIPQLPNRSVNFAYVDADHRYSAVLNDLELLLPKMAPGSWLCGHDYCAGDKFGVVRATAVFCDRHGLLVDYLTDEPPAPWFLPAGNDPLTVSYNSFGICIP